MRVFKGVIGYCTILCGYDEVYIYFGGGGGFSAGWMVARWIINLVGSLITAGILAS